MVNTPALGGQPSHPPATAKPTPNGVPASSSKNPNQPTIPYSARKSAPLDINTVERRGHASIREPEKRNRPHGLPEAPTYRPSEDEFRDPMAYIKSIADEASKFGICKIIPPDDWNPDLAINLEV